MKRRDVRISTCAKQKGIWFISEVFFDWISTLPTPLATITNRSTKRKQVFRFNILARKFSSCLNVFSGLALRCIDERPHPMYIRSPFLPLTTLVSYKNLTHTLSTFDVIWRQKSRLSYSLNIYEGDITPYPEAKALFLFTWHLKSSQLNAIL